MRCTVLALKSKCMLALAMVAAFCVAGCAQPSPFAQRNAMIGSLRESVSRLESDNQKLQHQVAELSTENHNLENRLVEEESHSRELARRLNDSRGGGGASPRLSSDLDSERPIGRSNPLPNSRSRRTSQPGSRPAPFAQIRNELQPIPGERQDEDRRSSGKSDSELFPDDKDADLQSRLNDSQTRWLSARRTRDEARLR
jgi:outer membrane murein-binding lipoprotein Lpp